MASALLGPPKDESAQSDSSPDTLLGIPSIQLSRKMLWIGGEGRLEKPVHVAFIAKDRPTVDEFYRAALAAGGKDNGATGLRPHYHSNYYAAFVLDHDGHNIEAACHARA
jgi:hypothetical protein